MLRDAFLNLNRFEKLQLKMLLKAADIHLEHLQLEDEFAAFDRSTRLSAGCY